MAPYKPEKLHVAFSHDLANENLPRYYTLDHETMEKIRAIYNKYIREEVHQRW